MTRLRRILLALAIALSLPAVTAERTLADEPEIYAPNGVAIGGYDPVSYFTEGHPVQGKAENALMWRGATWYFASPAAREAFEMNPQAYAPQYGGYCAFAMSKGTVAPSDPMVFTIQGGKLYLAHSGHVRDMWGADLAVNVERANGQWPMVLSSR